LRPKFFRTWIRLNKSVKSSVRGVIDLLRGTQLTDVRRCRKGENTKKNTIATIREPIEISSSREPHHLSQLYIASLYEVAWLLTGFRQPRGLLLNRPPWAVTWLQLQ